MEEAQSRVHGHGGDTRLLGEPDRRRAPEQVIGRRVTPNFFPVLGVNPIAGRIFTEEEDRTGAPVVMISYALWERRYARSPDAVNRDILINGLKYSIVG